MPVNKRIYERNMAARQAKKDQASASSSLANTLQTNTTKTSTSADLTSYKDKLSNLYNEISNRKFSYDQASDPLYQQYADMYTQNAKLAMQDTVAQASALTGGYANSYAATAGQAMYNNQMSQLNDKALELQQNAQNMYNAETDRLTNLYGMAQDEYNMAYQQSRDEVADKQWASEFLYQQNRDSVADTQWQKEFDEKQRQYDSSMALDYLQSGYNADGSVNKNSYAYKNYALDKDASDLNWIQSGYNKDGTINENSQWAKEFAYQQDRDKISDAQFAKQIALDYDKYTQDYVLNGYTRVNGKDGMPSSWQYTGTAEDAQKSETNKQKWAEMGYKWSDKAGEYQRSYSSLTEEQQAKIDADAEEASTKGILKETEKKNLQAYLDTIVGTLITYEEGVAIFEKYFPPEDE